MIARSVNAAAGVISAAMEQGRKTPAGLAVALDSAGLLNSPEHAAEVAQMRARLAEFQRPVDEDPIAYALTTKAEAVPPQELAEREVARRSVDRAFPAVAEFLAGHRPAVEDPHNSPLHHDYRVGRDLPPVGGAS